MQRPRRDRIWVVAMLVVVASFAVGVPGAAAAPPATGAEPSPVADHPASTAPAPDEAPDEAPDGASDAAPPAPGPGDGWSGEPLGPTSHAVEPARAVEDATAPARLTVELDAIPNDAQDFTVQVCGSAGCSSVLVDDDAVGPRERAAVFDPLDAGEHVVSIGAVAGWELTAFACGTGDVVDLAQRTATVVLDPGESQTCQFAVTFSPSITVRQDTVPDGPQDFGYAICPAALDGSCSAPSTPFVLDDDTDPEVAAAVRHPLPAGRYAVIQAAVPGWQLTALSCSTAEAVDLGRRRVVVELGGAEATSCTFTDRQGAVVIQQDLVPEGPQDFTFDVCPEVGACRSVVLDDDPTDTTRGSGATVDGLEPGTYTVTQVPIADQPLIDLTCNGGQADREAGRATLLLAAGQTLTCRFTNRPTSLTIVVDATPNTGRDFAFTTCGDDGCHDAVLDDDADATLPSRWSLRPTPAGTYRITQADVSGWALTGITCDGGATIDLAGRTATLELGAGSQITCTFSEQTGSLGVSLDTAPTADPQDFAFALCPVAGECRAAILDTDGDAGRSNSAFFEGLAPGVWTLTQAAVPGWAATSVTCNVGAVDPENARVTVVVAAGIPVSCAFRNSQTTLTVVHDALPDDGADVAFTACRVVDDCTGFSLDDDADPALPAQWSLRGGAAETTHRVQRVTTEGWGAAAVSCTGGEVGLDGVAAVELAPGQQVTCTFASRRTSLTVVHDTVPDDPQDFTYTGCSGVDGANGCGPFVLDDDVDPTRPAEITFTGLTAGTPYAVTLEPIAGFGLTSLLCDRGDVDLTLGRFTIALRPGEQVRCTFVVRSTSLTIRQASSLDNAQDVGYVGCRSAGGPGACAPFALDADSDPAVPSTLTGRGLAPGEYVITQDEVPGFGLSGLTCTRGVVDLVARRATVELRPGDQITCTFTVAATSVTIVQDTLPDGPQDVDFTGCAGVAGEYGCGPFVLDDDPTDGTRSRSTTARGLVAGRTYTVTQERVAGFGLAAINCNRGVVDLTARRVTLVLDPGQQVTCTFVLQSTSLTIVQDTVPNGPQDFDFRGCAGPDGALGCGTFVLDDDSGSASVPRSVTYGGLAEGVEYAVVQAPVSGYGLTSVSCTQGTVDLARRRAVVSLQPGQQVTCTFTTRATSLTIVEDVTPTSTQAFTFTGCRGTASPETCGTFELDDAVATATPASLTATGLEVGVDYVITQTQVASHALVDLTCTSGTTDLAAARATVRLQAGDQVTCTFTNRATSLAVVQDTRPNDTQAFSFTRCRQGDPPSSCATFVLDDSTSTGTPKTSTVNGLAGGTYTLAQALPAGYGYATTSAVTCEGADAVWDGAVLTIALEPGAQVTCTFVVDVTSLTVTLGNNPNDAQDMPFRICGPTPEQCTDVVLDDDGTATPTPSVWSRSQATEGQYTIEQTAVARWRLARITCTSGTTDLAAGRARVTLSAGEQVSCAFENTLTQLVIVEDTVPQGVRSFHYSLCVEGGSCWHAVLDDSASSATESSYSLAGVQPGRVTIVQDPEDGYGLTGLSCNTGETIDLANGRAIVDLDLGEQVTCTFVNSRSSITLRHATTPSSHPQDVGYTTCGPAWCDEVVLDTDSADATRVTESTHVEPPAGSYTMTMPALPAGWAVASLTCSGGPAATDRAARQVSFVLDPGERITCTYNLSQTALTVEMDLDPNGPRDIGFTLCPSSGAPCTAFALDDDGTTTPTAATQTFAGLDPGTYTVTQDPVDDWVTTNITCSAGEVVDHEARRATIELLPGERSTCTFSNGTPSLRLTHDTEPNASPPFQYVICATATAVCSTRTLSDGASPVLGDLPPGVYTITQHPVAGWEIQAIHCQVGDDVDTTTGQAVVRVSVGEAAWCWFVNRPAP